MRPKKCHSGALALWAGVASLLCACGDSGGSTEPTKVPAKDSGPDTTIESGQGGMGYGGGYDGGGQGGGYDSGGGQAGNGQGGSGGAEPTKVAWTGPHWLDKAALANWDIEAADYPRLALAPEGTLHLVWSNVTRNVSTATSLGTTLGDLVHSADHGSGFEQPEYVKFDEATQESDPRTRPELHWGRYELGVDSSNNVHLVWAWVDALQSPNNGVKIVYAKRTTAGWGEPQVVAENVANAGLPKCPFACTVGAPHLAIAGSKAFVFYSRSSPENGSPTDWVEYYQSTDALGSPQKTGSTVTFEDKFEGVYSSVVGLAENSLWGVGMNVDWDNDILLPDGGTGANGWTLWERAGGPGAWQQLKPLAGKDTTGFLYSTVVIKGHPLGAVSKDGTDKRVAWFHWVPKDAPGSPCPTLSGAGDDAGCFLGPYATRNKGGGWESPVALGTGESVTTVDPGETGGPLALAADASGVWYLAYRYSGGTSVYVSADWGKGWSPSVRIGRGDGRLDLAPLPSGKGVRLVWSGSQSTLPEPVMNEETKLFWADLRVE